MSEPGVYVYHIVVSGVHRHGKYVIKALPFYPYPTVYHIHTCRTLRLSLM